MERAPITISNRFLRLIAHHIFGDSPATVVRELVQNAHDAVLMRAATEAAPPDGWGVHVEVDERAHRITIVDTGIGMGTEDIVESLARLGAGAKEEERIKQLEQTVKNPEMLKNVAGVFGFGFVAAMMVSRTVEIWTRKKDAKPIYCRFDEGEEAGTYEEQEDDPTREVGTRVVLHVDPDRARIEDDLVPAAKGGSLLNAETLATILQKYCDLLEFEITLTPLGQARSIVNLRQAPWERGPRPSNKEMFGYFQRRFGERLNEPLDYIVIAFTRDTNNIEASGVLYVPRASVATAREEGKFEVFVKRIWVCDDDLGFLPEWATFLKGVIVSPDLAVALDRRGLDRLDRGYHDLRVALRDYLRAYLVELASKRRETFQELLDAHGARFRHGLLAERARFEGSRPVWFADLARTMPFRVFSRKYPGGYQASVNELLDVDPTAPLRVGPEGEKHRLQGVNRVVPPNQQSEFRRVIADKTDPIIVPESDMDLYYLQCIGKEFEDVLQIEDVEYRFADHFIEPISAAEQDRWQPFVQFIEELLRYREVKEGGVVNAGGIRGTQLPILIHWREAGTAKPNEEEREPRARFTQITTINTSHSFMQDLLKFAEDRQVRRIQSNSVVGNCLHASYHVALLEQNANLRPETFQDVAHQATEVMRQYLAAERDLDSVKTARDKLQDESDKKEKEIERLKAAREKVARQPRITVPEDPRRRHAAVVFVDLVGSTEKSADLDFADKAQVFDKYVQMLKKEIEAQNGFFDKFTGDGVLALFGVEDENTPPVDACTNAMRFADRAHLLTNEFGDRVDVRSSLDELVPGRPGTGVFTCRIAVSYGPVAFGQFGGAGSAVGIRMIQSARICSDKKLYGGDRNGGLIITRDVWHPIGSPDTFVCFKEKYQPRGLAQPVDLYRRR